MLLVMIVADGNAVLNRLYYELKQCARSRRRTFDHTNIVSWLGAGVGGVEVGTAWAARFVCAVDGAAWSLHAAPPLQLGCMHAGLPPPCIFKLSPFSPDALLTRLLSLLHTPARPPQAKFAAELARSCGSSGGMHFSYRTSVGPGPRQEEVCATVRGGSATRIQPAPHHPALLPTPPVWGAPAVCLNSSALFGCCLGHYLSQGAGQPAARQERNRLPLCGSRKPRKTN